MESVIEVLGPGCTGSPTVIASRSRTEIHAATDHGAAAPLLRDESALVIRNDPKQCRVCQGAPSRARRVYVSAVTVRYDLAMMASSTVKSILSDRYAWLPRRFYAPPTHQFGRHSEPGAVLDSGHRLQLSPTGQVEPADHIHLIELQGAIALGDTPDIQWIR